MRVDDFIDRFRVAVGDLSEPYFWSNNEITGFLNEAVQEACERARLIEDDCTLCCHAGISTCDLHSSVFEVKRLTLNGRPLTETSVEELDDRWPSWESQSGTPRWFVFQQANGQRDPRVRLVPTPTRDDTLAVTLYRGARYELDEINRYDEPEIPERYHTRLMDWMLHRAYLKQDSEVFNPKKAAESLALFVHAFGERPDANVQRKHRDRAPPIVRCAW